MNNEISNDRCYVVYKHTSPSEKVYIGITSQKPPRKRWRNGSAYKYNKHFYNAIQKYGWDNFKHEILFDSLTKEAAEQKEIELIAYYQSNKFDFGYNSANGGNCIGTVSNATKEKLSIAHKGKKLSPEHIEKIRINSKKQYGKVRNILIDINSIEICQYDRIGNFIKSWKSASKAGRAIGITASEINSCCRRVRKTAGNYIWRYADDELTDEDITWCNDNRNYGAMKPVCQYDLSGKMMNVYAGLIEATTQTGISIGALCNCCNHINRIAGGYIWRYKNEPLTEEDLKWCNEKGYEKNEKSIIQYSLSGEFVNQFKSAKQVKEILGFDNSTIGKACKSGKSSYGYIWRYADECQYRKSF